MLTISPVLNQL